MLDGGYFIFFSKPVVVDIIQLYFCKKNKKFYAENAILLNKAKCKIMRECANLNQTYIFCC